MKKDSAVNKLFNSDFTYQFYPCGYMPSRSDNQVLYVRYKTAGEKSRANNFFTVQSTELGAYVDTPDRELYFDRSASNSNADRPLRNWDKCVLVGLEWSTSNDIPGDRFMINHTAFTSRDYKMAMRSSVLKHLQTDKTIISDCLTGDTLLQTSQGIMRIDEYAAGITGQTPYLGNIKVALPDNKNALPVQRFKSKKRKVYELMTESGHLMRCSRNELFQTRRGWVKLADLKETDEIAMAFGNNLWSKKDVQFNYDKNTYLERKFSGYPDEVTCPFCGIGFQQLDSHLTFKHGYTVSDFLYDYGFSTKSKTVAMQHSSNRMIEDFRLPEIMTPELATLLGIIVGDGRIRNKRKHARISVSCGLDKDVAELTRKLFLEVFNLKTELQVTDTSTWSEEKIASLGVKPSKGSVYYTVNTPHSSMLMDFLDYIGLPATLSYYKCIPWSVLRSSKSIICAFLAGLFAADGHVNKVGLHGLYTSSRRMAQELSVCLHNLGIPTLLRPKEFVVLPPNTKRKGSRRVRRYGCSVHVRGRNANALFADLIDIAHQKKSDRQLNSKYSEHFNDLETQKVVEYNNASKNSGIMWSEVKSIKYKGKEVTYDLTFDTKEHEFLANSFWVHNSGGFQLRSGKEVWIDPEELTDFYNDYVDEGVTLDIPIPTYNRELLTRMLKVQENNSKLIIKNLDRGVKLANVRHGLDYQDFKFVREHLWEDERMQILCIPSSVMMPELKSIDRLLYHITHGQQYKQYHMLGIYQISWLSIAIKAVVEYNKISGREPILLTSDASSSIYSANSLRFHRQPVAYKGVTRWPIGNVVDAGGNQYNVHNHLTCNCMVCEHIKYTDVFKLLGDINIATWLTRHNEQETIRWMRMMEVCAKTMSTKDYIEFVVSQCTYSGKKEVKSVIDAFDYLQVFLNEGWDVAHKRYQHKISSLFNVYRVKSSLFENSHDGLGENEDVSKLNKHLDEVLKRYERYYKTGKKPKSQKGGKMLKGVGNASVRTKS